MATAEKYRLDENSVRGRHLRAVCDIGVGEVVLSEAPLLVWENLSQNNDIPNLVNYIVAFLKLPKEKQDQVLEMKYPEELTSPRMLGFLPKCEEVQNHSECSSLTVQQIHTLIAVAESNCHEYFGTGSRVELKARPKAFKSALFYLGSKVNHSCCPNMQYSSQNADGHLKYKALREIKSGDELTFSYIGDLFSSMTAQRRSILREEKHFECHCERCDANDFCRPLKCPCKNVLLFNGEANRWTCLDSECAIDSPGPEMLQVERTLYQKSNILEDQQKPECQPAEALALLHETGKALSYTHYLTIRCSTILSDSCAAHIIYCKGPSLSKQRDELKALAAWALLTRADLTERIADGCVEKASRLCCSHSDHPPLFQATSDVYFGAQYYLQLPVAERERSGVAFIKRYLPLIRLVYGEAPETVSKIEDMVRTTEDFQQKMCDECKNVSFEELKACSGCGRAKYCGKECQVKGWKRHKKACGKKTN